MEEDFQRAHAWHLEYLKIINSVDEMFCLGNDMDSVRVSSTVSLKPSCNQNTESANGVLWWISGNLNQIMIHFFLESTKTCLNREMQNPISLNSHSNDAWVEDLWVLSCPPLSFFRPLHYTINCIPCTLYLSQAATCTYFSSAPTDISATFIWVAFLSNLCQVLESK